MWSERLRPSFDDLGNLVLFGNDKTVQGAIINPETGCYAMVRTPSNRIHRVARIHADSALVFRPDTGREYIEGLGEMEVTLRQFGHRPDDEPAAPGQRRAVFGDAAVGGVSVRRTLHRRFLTM